MKAVVLILVILLTALAVAIDIHMLTTATHTAHQEQLMDNRPQY